MIRLLCAVLLISSSNLALARHPDAPWYQDLKVANVVLQAPEGGLPDESLEPLLRTHQGERFHPRLVRLDLATLYRVGEFASVEAHVEPWFTVNYAGEIEEAVLVQYRVRPAPKVQRVLVQGARNFQERQLLQVVQINTGQPFYDELDSPRVSQALVAYLRQQGFPDAAVEVDVEPLDNHEVEVWVRVHEGTPNLLTAIHFIGDLPEEVTVEDLTRWAAKAGMAVGQPFTTHSVSDAHQAIIEEFGSFGTLFQPYRGWISARVTPAVIQDRERGTVATFTIELGLRLELDVQGLGWRGESFAREALAIDERLRITRGFLEEAPERLQQKLQERGYYDAKAEVRLLQSRDTQLLKIRVAQGAPHTVARYRFEGNEHIDDRVLESVIKQASLEVLRPGYFTHQALEEGLQAATDYYRSNGYQNASLDLAEIRVRKDRTAGDAPRRMEVHITVDEGPQTTQASIWVEDAALDVDVAFIKEAREQLSDQPFSPQKIERLAQRVVERHREAGYLGATARVANIRPTPVRVESIIDVSPGSKVLLRSVVTRGTKTVRPGFVRKEVDLALGEPIASTEIERVRRALYDLGIFRSVSLDLLGDEDAKDLVISVHERPRWGFELGGGLSTDQGVRTFGRLTRRNLFGRAHIIDVYGVVGLEYGDLLHPEWRLAMNYSAPRFPTRQQRLILELLARERLQERTWTLGRTAAGTAIEWDLDARTLLRTQFRVEARQLIKVDAGTLIPGEPWTEIVQVDNPTLPSPFRLQHGLSVFVVYDNRDDMLQTTSGIAGSFKTEWSPGVFQGSQAATPKTTQFLKTQGTISGHLALGGCILHLSAGGSYGWAYAGGVLPLEDRYRLGGTGSLRGYARDSLGPRNLASRVDADWPNALAPVIDYALRGDSERWAPTGGDTRVIGTTELLLPFPALGLDKWDGYAFSLFSDLGNVWALNQTAAQAIVVSEYADHEPLVRIGTGLGLRVLTPVGPFQFDVAVNPQAALATGRQQVLLREQYEEPLLRVHLTLGDMW
jgi:outer membrane protein insertion porin family